MVTKHVEQKGTYVERTITEPDMGNSNPYKFLGSDPNRVEVKTPGSTMALAVVLNHTMTQEHQQALGGAKRALKRAQDAEKEVSALRFEVALCKCRWETLWLDFEDLHQELAELVEERGEMMEEIRRLEEALEVTSSRLAHEIQRRAWSRAGLGPQNLRGDMKRACTD